MSGFAIEVDANPGAAARNGQFTVSDGVSTPRTVSVTQAGAVAQSPLTSLAVATLDGAEVDVAMRVWAANGATAVDWARVHLTSTEGSRDDFVVYAHLRTNELQICDFRPTEAVCANWPPPMLVPGGAESGRTWGFFPVCLKSRGTTTRTRTRRATSWS